MNSYCLNSLVKTKWMKKEYWPIWKSTYMIRDYFSYIMKKPLNLIIIKLQINEMIQPV